MKVCEHCHKPFDDETKQKYCSAKCRSDAFQEWRKQRRRTDPTYGRSESGKRNLTAGTCWICGKPHVSTGNTCSEECANEALKYRRIPVYTLCLQCSKPIVTASKVVKKFCSRACYKRFRRLENYEIVAKKIQQKISAELAKNTLDELFEFIDIQTDRYIRNSSGLFE